MATLVEDARRMADWVANALTQTGYAADFSLESLREIDRFFDEHSRDGQAVADGLLAEQLGSRIFALGSYLGETIIRQYGGEWLADEADPDGEINIQVKFPGGAIIWPVQRVMKRFRNGPEDGIYLYGRFLGQSPAKPDAADGPSVIKA